MCPTQHNVVQITLTGPALIGTLLVVILSIQLFHPSLTCTFLALASICWIIYNDYDNFLLLGPGGTPSTFLGYLKIVCLRMFALKNPYEPLTCSSDIYPRIGYFQNSAYSLPQRRGPRPQIAGIAPQRQINQRGCPVVYKALLASIQSTADQNPKNLCTGISCFEKKGLSLFTRNPVNATCNGEIVHVHHSDRSMHMNMHPDDAKLVIERGWGERHPLARGGFFKQYVPREFMMIYAPRNREEMEVICRVIEAAGYWVSGEKINLSVRDEFFNSKESPMETTSA
ncbi:hypothetical protein F5884DRAFT_676405 [Xylogone sp. PMI_703]|nr:hypothetical protein F5884DRAFT_676405 [Xylogone sp. PMI_703]